ncbi:TPA: hypothetical protein N0F65_005132 [Lagenidium giganteum]|uniref:Uncharacterized protein n=1 Tax=Lagenidium giganteum TaxID=4803 RepID=A0AAV2YX20_9STRA|nr:TPA: hypothetical protein N0F65_005132 [Lagenidium giganteum]
MLYQLAIGGMKRKKKFAKTLKKSYRPLELGAEEVIAVLASMAKVDNVKDMTVILFVNEPHDGTTTGDFYRVLTSICSFFNSSTAFAVCVQQQLKVRSVFFN